MNWCATTPKPPGPLSKHQKYFLQSRGWEKNPSSSHLKSIETRVPYYILFVKRKFQISTCSRIGSGRGFRGSQCVTQRLLRIEAIVALFFTTDLLSAILARSILRPPTTFLPVPRSFSLVRRVNRVPSLRIFLFLLPSLLLLVLGRGIVGSSIDSPPSLLVLFVRSWPRERSISRPRRSGNSISRHGRRCCAASSAIFPSFRVASSPLNPRLLASLHRFRLPNGVPYFDTSNSKEYHRRR